MVNHLRNNGYGYANIVSGWILAVLCCIVIALRVWSRRLKKQSLMLNDWFAIVALIIILVLVSHVTQATVVYGLGLHGNVIGDYNVRQILKSLFGLKPEWAFANAFVKLSILHLYTVIFPLKWLRIAAYTVMVLAVLYGLAAFLEIFLSCFPTAYLWDPTGHPGGYCINLSQAWAAVGITNLIEDVLIILLPLPILWNLQMDTRRKLALSAIFSLGTFIIVVSAIRIKVILDFNPMDPSYTLGSPVFWSILEPLLGLINCCLPVIQPAICTLSGHRLWSMGSSRRGNDAPYKSAGSGCSNLLKGNKHVPCGPTNHFGVADVGSRDALHEKQIRGFGSTHASRGEEDIETMIETSRAILVEQRWEVSSK